MPNLLTSLISPNSGKSHKRVVSLVAAAAIIFGFVVDLFADVTVSTVLVESVMWLAIVGMSASVAERFAPKQKAAQTTMETKTTIVEPAPEEKP
jgi:hypothetical protein